MALVVLALVLGGCSGSPALSARKPTPAPAPSASASAPGAQARTAPLGAGGDGQLSVPEAVAKLHRRAFEPADVGATLGRPICFITLHDAALQRGDFYPLVLFANGSIGTWRQTPTGGEDQLSAKLSPEEQVRVPELLEAIRQGRALARETFDASAVVMGVSTRVDERVETLYFDHERIPAALSHLVGMLKQRLEANYRRP